MLIKDVTQVNKEWLSELLGAEISEFTSEYLGENHRSKKWRLHLHYNNLNNSPKMLFLKTSATPHEAQFYQAIQSLEHELPIVPCYDVAIEGQHTHILLEDLSHTHDARPPTQLPPINKECEMIIDGLADLHAYWWNHGQLGSVFGGKASAEDIQQSIDEDAACFTEFSKFLGDRLPQYRRDIYKLLIRKLPDILIARYEQDNLTLVFEDVHMGNFLYPKHLGDPLYFIDWEQWRVSLAMNDLAYMMGLFWSSERRSRLEEIYLKRYYERVLENGVEQYAWDDLWYDYRLSISRHLFIPAWQWQQQSPPADVWWNHLERICNAFEALNCIDLFA